MWDTPKLNQLRSAWTGTRRPLAEWSLAELQPRSIRRSVAIGVAGTAILSIVLVIGFGKGNVSPPIDTKFAVQAAFRGDLEVKVSATGTVEPVRIVEVSTELSGTISDIAVDYNDRVKAGQLLASLEDAVPARQLARTRAAHGFAEARLREARINLALAASEQNRKQRLAERHAISERELEVAVGAFMKATAQVEILEAELRIAAAEVDIAAANLNKTRIVAPIDGVVLRRNVERGQVIAASFQSPVLFRIAADLKHMQVKVDVDEADALAVRPGQPALFKAQAMRDRTIPAVVEKIYLGPEVVQGVVTYKAILGFDNDALQLKPGMTTTTDLTVAQRRNVLLVPTAALRFAPPVEAAAPPQRGPGAIAHVMNAATSPHSAVAATPTSARGAESPQPSGRQIYKLVRGVPTSVQVRIGETDGTHSEILDGDIAPGDSIVVDTAAVRP
ncbi:efflux RND transporter periplasmic adaptor subunit [Bradyrhizobium sp.]|uniref:efflux RND transporter periplasmic adaptor subunit n=1 Tax=Bradyrhizobium sp. TaxID=376 RepID=UPI0025C41BF3|nr:efflux RND transporter periplasmic adaptor subunit [Bradyrhizobium sp.]